MYAFSFNMCVLGTIAEEGGEGRAMRGVVADELPHDVPFVTTQLTVDGDLGVELVQGLRVLEALLAARGSKLQGSS